MGISEYDILYEELYSYMERRHFDYCATRAEQIGLSLWSEHAYPSVEVDEVTGVQTPRLIVGVGGLRVIAHRTREYAGCEAGTIERDENRWPLSASVTLYRMIDGRKTPFTAVVYMDERYPGEGADKLWDKMPATNLERCAESAALRKAFANETNGLYTPEELAMARISRRRERRTTAKSKWAETAIDPRTRVDLERRLAEMGLVDRAKREGVMAMLDQEFSHLGEDASRWGAAIRAVRSNPQEYGLA